MQTVTPAPVRERPWSEETWVMSSAQTDGSIVANGPDSVTNQKTVRVASVNTTANTHARPSRHGRVRRRQPGGGREASGGGGGTATTGGLGSGRRKTFPTSRLGSGLPFDPFDSLASPAADEDDQKDHEDGQDR